MDVGGDEMELTVEGQVMHWLGCRLASAFVTCAQGLVT
jgi:hypothetical protein